MASEKRLIDASDFSCTNCRHNRTGKCDCWCDSGEQYSPDLAKIPTVDAVEVVRCKECVFYEVGKDYLPYCNHTDGGIADYPREDDFCSYGERK